MKNIAFDIKLKELEANAVDFVVINDTLITLPEKILLGCRLCYETKPEPTHSGFTLNSKKLINYYEAYPDHQGPKEIRINMWLCPNCSRLIQELLPDFEFIGVNNVSI